MIQLYKVNADIKRGTKLDGLSFYLENGEGKFHLVQSDADELTRMIGNLYVKDDNNERSREDILKAIFDVEQDEGRVYLDEAIEVPEEKVSKEAASKSAGAATASAAATPKEENIAVRFFRAIGNGFASVGSRIKAAWKTHVADKFNDWNNRRKEKSENASNIRKSNLSDRSESTESVHSVVSHTINKTVAFGTLTTASAALSIAALVMLVAQIQSKGGIVKFFTNFKEKDLIKNSVLAGLFGLFLISLVVFAITTGVYKNKTHKNLDDKVNDNNELSSYHYRNNFALHVTLAVTSLVLLSSMLCTGVNIYRSGGFAKFFNNLSKDHSIENVTISAIAMLSLLTVVFTAMLIVTIQNFKVRANHNGFYVAKQVHNGVDKTLMLTGSTLFIASIALAVAAKLGYDIFKVISNGNGIDTLFNKENIVNTILLLTILAITTALTIGLAVSLNAARKDVNHTLDIDTDLDDIECKYAGSAEGRQQSMR
ncbi:MAG: hypothetical protein OEY79_03095 [Anaplasmataceae bacterium]|nr:hypothetical protein [Anaplasmataceae bacterium]